MKIPKSSELLARIPDEVGVMLPDYAHIDELGGDPAARQWILGQVSSNELSFTDAQIWQTATQIALRNIISTIGIPGPAATTVVGVLGAFDPQLSTEQMLKRIAGTLENALVNLGTDLLTRGIDAGVGFAVDAVSNVPIVGWVVQICWNLGKLIYKISQIQDPYEIKEKYPQSVFSPSHDHNVLNSLLLQLTKNDWSTLFYPPSVGKNASWKKPIDVVDLEGGGKRFVGSNPNTTPVPGRPELLLRPWIGFVPGTNWLHKSIEITNPGHKVSEAGATLLPSAQKQALWLWRQVSRTNSPAAFTLFSDTAESFWQTYIEDLRVAIKTSSISSDLKKKVFKFFNSQLNPKTHKWEKIFGWGDGSREIEYTPAKLLKVLRKRQLDFCDTLTVAYVDKHFGAMQDPVVRAKMERRQRDLLEHPAVCDVDLSNVPDVLLHDEIIERRKNMQCFLATSDKLAFGSGPDKPKPPELVDGFATPPLEPEDPRLPARWPWLVAGGVAAAGIGAGYYCRKDIERALRNLRLRIPT